MRDHNEKLATAITREASSFFGREGNRTALITVTRTILTKRGNGATLCISVFPVNKEKAALDFVNRNLGELRSVLKAGGEYEFSLYDPAKKQSTWARLNEPGHDFVVKAYDPEKDTVTVELRNRTFKLTLKEAKITQLSTAPGQPPAAVAAGPQPVAGRGQPGPTPPGRDQSGAAPALTPEQLRNLQADINRRREMRRQATASPGPATPAQPPAPGQSR